MSGDPTDLIREGRSYANALAIQRGKFQDADILNRVLDALVAAQDDNATLVDAYQSEHDRALRLAIRAAGADEVLAQRDEARAALAEANATIERVEARIARLREDYASELAATDPDTNWALGVKHAVQLIARELRREGL